MTVLGKSIPATILALVLLGGLGSAALVGYLSNMTQTTVTVNAPFIVKTVEGARGPYSNTEAGQTGWDDDGSISFPGVYGGDTVIFSNYIKKMPNTEIPVKDTEMIEYLEGDMEGIDKEFTFYGARYWRPAGSAARAGTYNENDDGWDPYTKVVDSTITCHGQSASGSGTTDISSESWVGIEDGICYYTNAAFDYELGANGHQKLVSAYDYTYPSDFTEEIMQVKMTFALDIAPGTYNYTRQIMLQ